MPEQLNPEYLSASAQDRYYNSSRAWVLAIKDRHDPEGLLGILDNDPEKYPYQKIGNVLVPSYQPSQQEILEAGGRDKLQENILKKFEIMCGTLMGQENFERFIGDLLASTAVPKHPENTLRNIWGRLRIPRQNVSAVAMHPNIKALPIFSVALPIALARAEFLRDKETGATAFDLFEFSKQNLMVINPALAASSFGGKPTFDVLSQFATLIQAVPPTRNGARVYGYEKQTRREINTASKQAYSDYLESLYAEGKSAYLTIDPTASTADPVVRDGKLVALRRKAVAPTARQIILNDFHFCLPMTMNLDGQNTAWDIGLPIAPANQIEFDSLVDKLNKKTEEIAGVPVIFGNVEQALGQTALGQPQTD